MSVKRLYYVKSARQRFARESTGERVEVKGRKGRGGGQMTRRVTKADTSRPLPNYRCGKCGDEILPGMPYRYWEPYFRSSAKSIRCMKDSCTPRPSERESSIMSEVLAAQESAEDQLAALGPEDADASTFESIRDEVTEAMDSVIEQYREADGAFGGQGATQSAEMADELESQKDELDGLSFEDPPERDEADACDDHEENDAECDDCADIYNERRQEWFDEQVNNLQDAMGGF